jgi:hypothetical protein
MNNLDNHILKELLADRADTRSRLLELEYVILKTLWILRTVMLRALLNLNARTLSQNLIRTSTTSLLAIDPNIDAPKKVKSKTPIGAGKCPSDWPFKLPRPAENSRSRKPRIALAVLPANMPH